MQHQVSPVGYVQSCFREKFAIPRQPSLAPAARGVLQLVPPYDQAKALDGLEQVSHVWLVFLFHQTLEKTPRLQVRPPRLGGNQRTGVFATRSTHRPNGIGLSAVRLEGLDPARGQLLLSGLDLLDGTPVLDIKPYVPYADIRLDAFNHMAPAPPPGVRVSWQPTALEQAHSHALRLKEPLVELIEQCLAQDPRPAYQIPAPERRYGSSFLDVEVRWHYPDPQQIRVLDIRRNSSAVSPE